jgi:outer membrane protein
MRLVILASVCLPAAAFAADTTLTFDQAIATARAHHPQLRQARAQNDVADARADQARAPLLPQLSGSARYTHSEAEGTTNGGINTTTGTIVGNLWSFGLNASQLIWDFGRTTGNWDAAKANAVAQEASGRVIEKTVILNVRTAYFTARADKALLEVAKETLANQEKHLQQVVSFIEVGTRPEIDRAQSKTDVANARLAMIRADNAYAVAKAQLNLAMGVVQPTSYDVADETVPEVAGEDGGTDDLVAEAIRSRPELAQLRAQIDAQDASIRAAKGDYFPSISASAAAAESGPGLDSLGWSWNVGVSLTWPIFSGFATRSNVRAAEATRVVIDAQTEAERQQVRLEVEQARLGVVSAKSEIGAAEEALVNARERLRLAEGRYQTGVGNIIELGDAQVAVTNAAAQKVQADYDLATARVTLLSTLGR